MTGEEDEARGFNDIKMIFDEDEEDKDWEKEGYSSKNFDEVEISKKLDDPKSDPDMQRNDC